MKEDIVKKIAPIENKTNTKKDDNRFHTMKVMNQTALEIVKDSNKFKQYLDLQSSLDKYSVGNLLLIIAQAPNTKQLTKMKQSLKDKEIILIQPKKTNKSNFQNYKLFSSERPLKKNKYYEDNKLLLKAFLNDCPVDIKVVDETEEEKNIYWNDFFGILYIKKGLEYNELFEGLARELTKEELGASNTELEKFKCKCITYMILKKYGKDVSNYKFDDIPEEFIKDDPIKIRKELNELKEGLNIFNNRVNSFFDEITKRNTRKNYSR
ncbi:MAG: hypothetical protein IJ105_04170 [Bacilli bacterium]|nr:hypothetical protein [Bacilli bacterium]